MRRNYLTYKAIRENKKSLGTEKLGQLNIDLMCSTGAFQGTDKQGLSRYGIIGALVKMIKKGFSV